MAERPPYRLPSCPSNWPPASSSRSQELEAGKVDLEKSIERYERGEALKSHCERLLKEAEGRVERIRLTASGRPAGTEPLDGEDDAPF
jgi:exodeoxyribonuclease VII small subunit